MQSKTYTLPIGSFSRTFVGRDGVIRAVAYHTPSQSVALLEGDSANVWQRIFDDKGGAENALAYIVANGSFKSDPVVEARGVLDGFVASLCNANLLVDPSKDVGTEPQTAKSPPAGRHLLTELEDTESQVAQFMADNRIFYSLVLELTYRCNEKCVHCYCPEIRKTAELTAAQISELLDEFESMGGMSLLITGGEVFARKDIKAILRDLRHRNIVVNVISNLTMADEDCLDLFASLSPRSVGCSIYSADPAIHDGVTQVSGSWNRSVAAIRTLRARGVPVILKAPLMEHTIDGWRNIEVLASDLGCDVQFDVNITPRNDGGQSPVDLRVRDKTALADLFSSRFYRLYMNGEAMAIADDEQRHQSLLCGAGSTGLSIGPDGTIRPCIGLMMTLGKWPEQSLGEIWECSPFFTEWANQKLMGINKCSTCQHFAFCNRCPGSWQLEMGSPTNPADYTCYLAQILSGCTDTPPG